MDLFVRPRHDRRGISAVVLWPEGTGPPGKSVGEATGRLVAVQLTKFPAPRPARERWLVTCVSGTTLPDGAALVDGQQFLGRLRRPWSGQSLVTPLAASGRAWAFSLLTGEARVLDLVARMAGRQADGQLRLEILAPRDLPPGARLAGELFTGANGPHCPAGFRVGTLSPINGPPVNGPPINGPPSSGPPSSGPPSSGPPGAGSRLDASRPRIALLSMPPWSTTRPQVYIGGGARER